MREENKKNLSISERDKCTKEEDPLGAGKRLTAEKRDI